MVSGSLFAKVSSWSKGGVGVGGEGMAGQGCSLTLH